MARGDRLWRRSPIELETLEGAAALPRSHRRGADICVMERFVDATRPWLIKPWRARSSAAAGSSPRPMATPA